MDAESSYNLEIQIVAPNSRARWFLLNNVVDADHTNFIDLVAEVVDKYPHDYGDSIWQRVHTRWVLATRTHTRQIKILPVGLPVPAGG